MTPEQRDPQQQPNIKDVIFAPLRGLILSPDSDSVRKMLAKSGLGSKFGPQKLDFCWISVGFQLDFGIQLENMKNTQNEKYNVLILGTPLGLITSTGVQYTPSPSDKKSYF